MNRPLNEQKHSTYLLTQLPAILFVNISNIATVRLNINIFVILSLNKMLQYSRVAINEVIIVLKFFKDFNTCAYYIIIKGKEELLKPIDIL